MTHTQPLTKRLTAKAKARRLLKMSRRREEDRYRAPNSGRGLLEQYLHGYWEFIPRLAVWKPVSHLRRGRNGRAGFPAAGRGLVLDNGRSVPPRKLSQRQARADRKRRKQLSA